MIRLMSALASLLLVGVLAAASEPATKSLVQVDVRDQKDVTAEVGDLIQLSVKFPIVPQRMISELKVEAGCELSKVVVVRVPHRTRDGKLIIGAGEIAAFLRAEKPGESTVKLVANDADKSRFELKVIVKSADAK